MHFVFRKSTLAAGLLATAVAGLQPHPSSLVLFKLKLRSGFSY
jgi:hypothetical protein